jgi:hypothetical protein
MALNSSRHGLRCIAGGIKYAQLPEVAQSWWNIRAKVTTLEPHVDESQVGLVTQSERDSVGHSSGNSAYFVSRADEGPLAHVSHEKIVLDDQYLWHHYFSQNIMRSVSCHMFRVQSAQLPVDGIGLLAGA